MNHVDFMILRLLFNSSVLCVAICVSSTMVSCDALAQSPIDSEKIRLKSLLEAHIKYEARLRLLNTSNESQLATELERDSLRNKEPWNSMAFDEATKRIEQNPAIAQVLAPFINKSDRSALLGLLVIRRAAPSIYKSIGTPQSRTDVLIDAFKHSTTFNLWGLPHLGLKEASQALIEESSTAAQALLPLLDDKSQAPAWGSSFARESKLYQYTISDYAFAISKGIEAKQQGKEHTRILLPKNPTVRANQISDYKKNFVLPSPPDRITPAEPPIRPDATSPGAPEGLRIN